MSAKDTSSRKAYHANTPIATVARDPRLCQSKLTFNLTEVVAKVSEVFENVHKYLYEKAKKARDDNTVNCTEWSDFCAALAQRKVILAPFCGAVACEEQIREDSATNTQSADGTLSMGAKSLCIPFDQAPLAKGARCINPSCNAINIEKNTLFGRSY